MTPWDKSPKVGEETQLGDGIDKFRWRPGAEEGLHDFHPAHQEYETENRRQHKRDYLILGQGGHAGA